MPDYNAVLQQQIEQAKRQIQQEMPAQMAGADVQPMGWTDRIKAGLKAAVSGGGQTEATTGRGGWGLDYTPPKYAVRYNPAALGGQRQDYIDNLLTHELTHVGQFQQQPWYQQALSGLKQAMPNSFSYSQDPTELEAYQAANDRANRLGQPTPGQPSFYDASKMQTGDIWLPRDKR